MVPVTINGRDIDVARGTSIFDAATRGGIRIPTSCVAQANARSASSKLPRHRLLSPRTDHERHLTGPFRLSCQSLVAADDGSVECHTMRRGQMRIERHALNLPVSRNAWRLDPSIVRDNTRIVDRLTGKVLSESGGPIYG